jgi:GT2 family glycosyltransferase
MSRRSSRRIVLLGMITKMPVPGVLWQTLHYLLGFRRLGYEVLYVEAHARTPSTFSRHEGDPASRDAASFLHQLFSPFGLGNAWAFHALHDDGTCWGLGLDALLEWYRSADLLINLHGGTRPRPEHAETGRLVFVGTDPVQLEVELWQRRSEAEELLGAHCAWFTFGENYGNPDCGLPVSDRYRPHPTRQPVVLDLWGADFPDRGVYTTVASWRQPYRRIRYRKEVYHWSKDLEFRKFLSLPQRSGRRFELALSSFSPADRRLLEAHGWRIREASEFSTGLYPYRDYVQGSRGEFTVAKDQNVRLRSGWFSDRSATYLAAGRPVITQETGFSGILPTGRGLFGFEDLDGILAALDIIESDYPAACRAARDVARSCFDFRVVLPKMLGDLGVEGPGRSHPAGGPEPQGLASIPGDLVLEPASRRPLRLDPETERTLLDRPWPGAGRGPRPDCHPEEAASEAPARPRVSIVVVTHGNLALTRLCLESLLAQGSTLAFEVLVIDNASPDGTPDYLRALAAYDGRVRLVLNESNEGLARACNVGTGIAVGEFLVFLNNDTALAPGWLEGLIAHLADPSVGAVTPVTNRIGTEAEVPDSPRTYGEFLRMAQARRRSRSAEGREVAMVALFCLALRRAVWEEVGPLDAAFGLGLFEDDDYSVRLAEAGYRLICAEDVFVYHLGEASFGDLVADGRYGGLFQDNRRRFEAKWGRRWERPGRKPDDRYRALVERVRRTVEERLPSGATLAVVSRGDDQLLAFDGIRAWHFPRQADGVWAGFYPATDAEAVAQLRAVRARGAQYLLVPEPAFWWLDHYPALRHHVEEEGEMIIHTHDLRLFRLPESPSESQARPVFIIGSPRSGTSVLTWSLGAHPNLYPLEETVWFGSFHKGLHRAFELGTSRGERSQISAQGIDRTVFMEAFGRTVHQLIMDHRRWPETPVAPEVAFARARSPRDPKGRWVDGTPENSFFVQGLAELFPEARFIHLLREPAAVVRSLRGFHNIGGRPHTASEAYDRWFRHVKACLEAESALGPDRVLRVLHRDLLSDPAGLVHTCLEFIGESWCPDCLLPLERRINSSGTGPVLPEGGEPDSKLVAEAEALEAELFGREAAGS